MKIFDSQIACLRICCCVEEKCAAAAEHLDVKERVDNNFAESLEELRRQVKEEAEDKVMLEEAIGELEMKLMRSEEDNKASELLVDALTDNRNRTASEVRAAFSKYGGNLGETNSVGFMFDRIGLISYPKDLGSSEAAFEAAVESGASDVEATQSGYEFICNTEEFNNVREYLEDEFGPPESAGLSWKPQSTVELSADQASTLLKLLDVLDDNDDVQSTAANFEISDEVLEKLTN